MNNRKTFIIAGLIVAVVIIVAVIVMVAAKQKGNSAQAPVTTVSGIPPTASSTVPTPTSSGAAKSGLSISVQPSYIGASFSFNYPMSWSISNVKPFSMTNFNGAYLAGGILPPGGAEIDMVTTTIYNNLGAIIGTELLSAKDISTSTVTVSGVACEKASYHGAYAGNREMASVALYCDRGSELWKIYLAYPAADPAAPAHLADFEGVLQSMRFLP